MVSLYYFDNNATTRPAPQVVTAITHVLKTNWANPSSPHSLGIMAARAIAQAREKVAGLLDMMPEQVVFTSGATEANETVLRHFLQRQYDLITSVAEHPAVNGLYRRLAPERIRMVPVDRHGCWDLAELEHLVSGPPALVALAWANGETGVLQDMEKIGQIARGHGQPVLIDACQVVGRLPFSARELDGSYLTLSGHKLYAGKGIGALVRIDPQCEEIVGQSGGKQESGRRGGTENVSGIVGLGEACELLKDSAKESVTHLRHLRDAFEDRISHQIQDVRFNGAGAMRIPNTSNVCFSGVDGMALVARLDHLGICCSQVSACSSSRPDPSRVLTAMGLRESEAYSSLRFSFGLDNLMSEVTHATQCVVDEVRDLRKMMGSVA